MADDTHSDDTRPADPAVAEPAVAASGVELVAPVDPAVAAPGVELAAPVEPAVVVVEPAAPVDPAVAELATGAPALVGGAPALAAPAAASLPAKPPAPKGAAPAVPADEHRDVLPEELDASTFVGPYTFPNNNRRRVSGLICAGAGFICVALYALRGPGVLVNRGMFYGGLFLLALACYHFVSGVTLRINETDALVAATKSVGFAVGHASAQLSWRGLASHPTWRILLYSADDPPSKRALVLVDGVVGTVGDHLVEENPEDWSSLDR